ncbi:hypothetical protein, partial [Aeromonas salmonicida]|uniref:hypothetical protein n=1 Tax=Aeromonas salmonicida TaxID=645 RepID=UPI003D321D8F
LGDVYKRQPLKGVSRWLAGLWCWGLVLAGFGLPFVILLDYGVRYFELSWTSLINISQPTRKFIRNRMAAFA